MLKKFLHAPWYETTTPACTVQLYGCCSCLPGLLPTSNRCCHPTAATLPLQVGAELVITLNTTRSSAPELQRMNVQLAYLRSYTGLGMALVK
jgi:hypothetical protein